MSYDNATPKVLKFLISNGDLVDEAGNVIAHSDDLEDMYNKASPQVKKYLLSDGSVVDEDNNLIIKNEYFKKVYDQAEPKVAKYLHADGTIDENPGSGSGGNVQNNKSVTITENGTAVINPDSGYDSIKKVTAEINVSEIDFTSKVWVYNKSGSDMFIALDSENKPLPAQSNIADFLTKCYAIIFPSQYDVAPEYLYKDSEQYTPLYEDGTKFTKLLFIPQGNRLVILNEDTSTTLKEIAYFDPTNFIQIPLINAMLLIND